MSGLDPDKGNDKPYLKINILKIGKNSIQYPFFLCAVSKLTTRIKIQKSPATLSMLGGGKNLLENLVIPFKRPLGNERRPHLPGQRLIFEHPGGF